MSDDRAAFEAEELRGLAEMHGATRGYTADGIGYWQFPPWRCPHCQGRPLQPGCPEAWAYHPEEGGAP